LRAVYHPKLALMGDAVLVVAPDHCRIFLEAGWSKARLRDELMTLLQFPTAEMVAGAQGIGEGIPENYPHPTVSKFHPGGLLIVRAGGSAGLFSAIIPGWGASGEMGSTPVSKEITA
ncbi:MAG: thioredoxin, partial [Pseudomonadota bacterium]